MLTAALRGKEEKRWASMRLLSTFFRCSLSRSVSVGSTVPETTSSTETHTDLGSVMAAE